MQDRGGRQQRRVHRVGLAILRGRPHRNAFGSRENEHGERESDRREVLHPAFAQQQHQNGQIQPLRALVAVEELVRVVLVVPLQRAAETQVAVGSAGLAKEGVLAQARVVSGEEVAQ